MTGPYKACHTSKDDPPYVYGIDGPGNGIGYHAWFGNPENTFMSMNDAERVAKLMNMAYAQGILKNQKDVKGVLGI